MIWYVITDSETNYHHAHSFWAHKLVLERLAEDVCLMLHYKQVTQDRFVACRPWAICHSGGSAIYDDYDVLETEPYRTCIREWDVPQIGFCGGHQVIAVQFGSEIGPMRSIKPDEPDLNPGYWPGQYKEWGIYPVRILAHDPIFAGLDATIRVQEYHSWEVKQLAPDLRHLASSEHCAIQAFVHESRPIYGTQFHPEQSSDAYPDGFQLLRNFFEQARQYVSDKADGNGKMT